MKTILVDARYFSSIVRNTRTEMRMNHAKLAQMLGMTPREYLACEHGKKLFPEGALMRMLHFSLMGLNIRYSLNNLKRKK